MSVKKIAYVVFVFPVIASLLVGGYVLSDVLGQPDRKLNMWQFKSETLPSQHGDKDIRVLNLSNSYSLSVPLDFSVKVNNTAFDCGDLYMTLYDLNTSPQQAVAQNAYFSQCFVTKNSSLPINDAFSPIIDKAGLYQLIAEMRDRTDQKSINVTATFRVQ